MHLSLTLSDCFSLSYDISRGEPLSGREDGFLRLRIRRDRFAPLIRKGVRCRLADYPLRSRPGRVTAVQAREDSLELEVRLKKPLPH